MSRADNESQSIVPRQTAPMPATRTRLEQCRADCALLRAELAALRARNAALVEALRTIQVWSSAQLNTEYDYARMAEAIHKRTIGALTTNGD